MIIETSTDGLLLAPTGQVVAVPTFVAFRLRRGRHRQPDEKENGGQKGRDAHGSFPP
jgi:hypothetical protein